MDAELESKLRNMWQVRSSDQEGFTRTYFTSTPAGDELEVDFHFARKMVQIRITLAEEHGRQYTAVIKSGTIIRERDITSRRALDLTSRMYPLREIFGYLPEEMVLRVIDGSYGIPNRPYLDAGERAHRLPIPLFSGQLSLRDRLKKYLDQKREVEGKLSALQRFVRRIPAEISDLALGSLLLWGFFQDYLTLIEFAGFCGFLGIFLGAVDWLWRQRSPFLPKVILLLTGSLLAVYYQIQYRIWGVFL